MNTPPRPVATLAQTRAGIANSCFLSPARAAQFARQRPVFHGPRSVHGQPPVLSGPTLASTITSFASFSKTSTAVRVYRGKVAVAGGSYPNDQFVRADYVTTNNEASAIAFETSHDGTEFEFLTLDNSARFRVLVDGKIAISSVVLGATGNLYFYKLTFPTRSQKVITVEGCNNFFWGGGKIGPGDTLYYPPASPQTKVLFLGDSYTEGTGAGASALGAWSHLAAEMLGWDGWSSGSGSTGWATAGTNQQTFRGRLSADVIANNPRVVVIAGGINDETWVTANGQAAYEAEVAATLDALNAGLPLLDEIVIVGPWWPSSAASGVRDTIRTVLAAQAAIYGALYIEPKGWITGTGRVGTTTGTGNADYYTSSDAVHPSTAGHAYLARRFVEAYLTAHGVVSDAPMLMRGEPGMATYTGSASLDFGNIAADAEATLTITVTGATTANTPVVALGWSAALEDGIVVKEAWVSAANTVSVRVRNVSAGDINPAAVTCRARVWQE